VIRKLILSVVGSFWSNKGPMAIAVALFMSVVFLVLQHHYQPFKSKLCNQVQQIEMQCLCFVYFAGLLLRVQVAAEEGEKGAIGRLLVWMVVLVLLSMLTAVGLQVHK
jgi:hypothetical protein